MFIQQRCFKCQDTLNKGCDILLADPWLTEYLGKEKDGQTLFTPYTDNGMEIVKLLAENKAIVASKVANNKLCSSQMATIQRKFSYKKQPSSRDKLTSIRENKFIRKYCIKNNLFFKGYIAYKNKLEDEMLEMSRKRILIINQPLNNRGDESAHRGLVRKILTANPNVIITILFLGEPITWITQFKVDDPRVRYITLPFLRKNNLIGKFLSHLNIALYNFVTLKLNYSWIWNLTPYLYRLKKIIKDSDFVVCAPGGICMGGFQNWNHIKMLGMAKVFKKPLVYYGRSFGPFPTLTEKNKQFKEYSLKMLNYMSYIAIRDKKSEEIAQELGIPFVSTADSAFLDLPRVSIPVEIKELIGNKPYMVFVPNLLIWHYAFKDKISKEEMIQFYSKMAKTMLEVHPDWNILMLPQTMLNGTYSGDDKYLFEDIIKATDNNRITTIADTYSSDVQQTIIKDAKLLIGARYHSIVFALNNNVPFIALSYEHKIEGLLEALDKKDCMIDITKSILSESGRDLILQETKKLMLKVSADIHAQEKAQEMAEGCFNKFAQMFL